MSEHISEIWNEFNFDNSCFCSYVGECIHRDIIESRQILKKDICPGCDKIRIFDINKI
jgi:hypothetical protein